jgi:hypothetical protein
MFLRKSKTKDVLEFLNFRKYTVVKVTVPTIFQKKLEYIFLMVYKNSIELQAIIDFFFMVGIDLFFKLIEEHKVTSFLEMMRVVRYMQDSLKSFIISCQNDDFMISSSQYHFINENFKKRHFTTKQVNEFFEFCKRMKTSLFGKVVLLGRDELEVLFIEFDKEK